ncbi:MAG: thioredoxin family protein [Candidatus Wallbacteria bacterium]|nr:thioredoxin family protein [Candidatus Wallbacteria bacterium]
MRVPIWTVIAGFAVLGGLAFSGDTAKMLRPGSRAAIGAIGEAGLEIDIERYRVPGKMTIFDFHSRNCPPCRAIAPGLQRLVEARADIAVRTINVDRPGSRSIDFSSPVAEQYGIRALPHFVIYDSRGRRAMEGKAAHRQVSEWIEQLPAPEEATAPAEEPPRRRRSMDDYPAGSGGDREAGS